jgi:HSP20 family protein
MDGVGDSALRKLEQMLARDPLLRDVVGRTLPRSTRPDRFTPDIDVIEIDGGYVILMDVPGVARESLDVQLDGTKLIVEGEKQARHPQGGRSKTTERGVGKFRREFLLPAVVDGDRVTAKLADGVLRIEVPRIGAAQPRHVSVT